MEIVQVHSLAEQGKRSNCRELLCIGGTALPLIC